MSFYSEKPKWTWPMRILFFTVCMTAFGTFVWAMTDMSNQ